MEAEKLGKVVIGHSKGSGAIEEVADLIFAINNPDRQQNKNPGGRQELVFYVSGRSCPSGVDLHISADLKYLEFNMMDDFHQDGI
jgi:hypothetical protein